MGDRHWLVSSLFHFALLLSLLTSSPVQIQSITLCFRSATPDATSATSCVQTCTKCLPFYIFIWMDAYDLVLLHKCTRVCVSAKFIVMKPTESLGYISLGACQTALMPVAQSVIVLSLQTHICMKRVTSGFLLHSINHLKQIRQRQIWLSLHQCI